MKENAAREENNIIYQESLDFSLLFRLLLGFSVLIILVLLVISVFNGPALSTVLLLCLFIFISLTMANFWTLEFVVTDEHVIFGFGVLKKVFPRSRIVYCEPHQLRFKNYLGIGIRFGLQDGTTAYNTRFGKGVEFEAAWPL